MTKLRMLYLVAIVLPIVLAVALMATPAHGATVKPPSDINCSVKVLTPKVKLLTCDGYIGLASVQSSRDVLVSWLDARYPETRFTCRYQIDKDRKTRVACKPL